MKYILSIVTMFIFSIFVFTSNSFSAGANELDVVDAVKQAKENRLKFDMQYKGKRIIVKGVVNKIEEKRGHYELMIVETGRMPNPFKSVICIFDKPDTLLELKTEQEVKVSGMYKGKGQFEIGEITLYDAKIEN